jgi:hypothetical protein
LRLTEGPLNYLQFEHDYNANGRKCARTSAIPNKYQITAESKLGRIAVNIARLPELLEKT